MWKAFWRKWTIDKPAILGDWLWDVLVVRLAAFLDRMTFRQIVAFIPVVILVVAYYHSIPIPPELLLVGDLLAYIDIFSMLFLLGILSRVTTLLFVGKRALASVGQFARNLMSVARRLDFRHRREQSGRRRKRMANRSKKRDDEPLVAGGMAWA